ncbi:extracellular tyrosine-protein kinase PKDCC [Scleropages formosus]|uniref:Extracellular tyrosine-protein kinase PKDCC n=2 Tax=Scleropages formosus TaxID=113540 RepID=A0A8C9SDL3_SCLFO|nr:extracellular tyrosine-protein kinase PKDCC-like [Scleropages formosus]
MVAPSVLLCVAALFALSFISLSFFAREWDVRVNARALATGLLHSDAFPASTRQLLLQELQERRAKLLPDLTCSGEDRFAELRRRALVSRPAAAGGRRNCVDSATENTHSRQLECSELRRVHEAVLLGLGYTKAVFGAVLRNGLSVALKSVNAQGADMSACLRDLGDASACYELVSCKLSREIVLLQSLQHPNIIQLYGYCHPGKRGGGVMSALEQGSPLQMIQLLQTPWEERFRVCLGLVRLLDYLSTSPLGSVVLLDFQPRQFVLVSGELKLTDLDDASIGDPVCSTDADCVLHFPLRNFSIACSSEGICKGLNEKRNLYNSYRYFFTYLLPHRAPPALQYLIERIMNSTGELKGGINDTLEDFEELLHLYKSGLYLENLPSSIIKDYTVAKRTRAAGGKAYRCWPSYDHSGCVLSVHGAHEAALLCHSHRECACFTLGSRRTWTGRILASFTSSFDDLVPDVNSEVYVKKAGASDPAL